MDGLLRRYLNQFIRRGSMTFATTSGDRFSSGDGTSEPVSARFLKRKAQIRVLLDPEFALGEMFVDGSFERGMIVDALDKQ